MSEEESKPVAVKPALKQEGTAPTSKQLQWDEKAIEEHDQLRGTRMKIDEPNTPYNYYSDSGAESDGSRSVRSPGHQKETIRWDVLQNRLDSIAAVRDAYEGEEGDEENEDEKMRRLEFQEHRREHYNEMELVKKFRQEHPGGVFEDDAEDGADGDDENE